MSKRAKHNPHPNPEGEIEFFIATPSIYPTPPGSYHWELLKMQYAFALEAALLAKGDYFGNIQRAAHPDKYPEPNPNPYYARKSKPDPYQGLVGFRFEVKGTKNIVEAYETVYDIVTKSVGTDHNLLVGEVSVSRMGTPRENRYHPHYNPSGC